MAAIITTGAGLLHKSAVAPFKAKPDMSLHQHH